MTSDYEYLVPPRVVGSRAIQRYSGGKYTQDTKQIEPNTKWFRRPYDDYMWLSHSALLVGSSLVRIPAWLGLKTLGGSWNRRIHIFKPVHKTWFQVYYWRLCIPDVSRNWQSSNRHLSGSVRELLLCINVARLD